MWTILRMNSRRRAVIFGSMGFLTMVYLFLVFISQLAMIKNLPGSQSGNSKNAEKREMIEYTLPSLDEVLKSVVDLDFQRVLSDYRIQYEEVPKSTPHVKIIIASTWRTGSTLLGEILSAHPGVFYHYEPLMSYGMVQINKNNVKPEMEDLLKNLLLCNYENQKNYLMYAYANTELFVRNTRLWYMCSAMPRFKCFMPEILERICSIFPVHVMKLVRARLSVLAPLLEDPNTRIVWLTRDPRAIISSRTLNVDWCLEDVCKKPSQLCNDILEDYNSYTELKRKYPGQLMFVRYEDFGKDPYTKSKSILEFAGLTMHTKVTQYLTAHLNNEFEAPWSTIHDPGKQVKKWMKVTPWNAIVQTQYHCRSIMNILGYRPFDSERELASGNAVNIVNIP